MTTLSGLAKRTVLAMGALILSAGVSAQVTWTVEGGKVTGAKNISVAGSFYDVAFSDFYHEVPDFLYRKNAVALAFSQALVNQVFVPNAPLNLDESADMLNGCEGSGFCQVFTASDSFAYQFFAHFAINRKFEPNYYSGPRDDSVSQFPMVVDMGNLSRQQNEQSTFAIWSHHVAAVPEPETYAMLLAGLGLIGGAVRRKMAVSAVA